MTTDNQPALQPWWIEFVDRWNEHYPAVPLYDTHSAKFYVQRAVKFILTGSIDGDNPAVWPARARVPSGVVAIENWFDLALRYLRGDPALTDVPYSSDSVFADFLRFWDAQTPHFRSVIGSVFRAAPQFVTVTAPIAAPTHRCNGVNGAERHGTQNKCTVCGEYRNGWYDSNGMEVSAPIASQDEQRARNIMKR